MTARKRSLRGFTLVELLVVITIIGMLVTLAVTGVQYARKAALRAKCTNYQSELAKGIKAYETAKGYFPGYKSLWKDKPVNWVVMILEYTDHADVWQAGWRDTGAPLATQQAIDALNIKGFACPGDSTNTDPAPLSYVLNARIARDLTSTNLVARENNKKSTSDIVSSATTPLLGERMKSKPIVTGPWVNVSGTNAAPNIVLSGLTFFWPTSGVLGNILSSAHGDGALVTFCDGRTEWLADTADCAAYLSGPP